MRSGEAKGELSSIKLLVVCLRTEENDVRSAISRHAATGWERRGEIHLITVADRLRSLAGSSRFTDDEPGERVRRHQVTADPAETNQRIDGLVPRGSAARVIVVGEIGIRRSAGDNRDFRPVSTCRRFEESLPAFLQASKLDWRTQTVQDLGHYHSFSIGVGEVEEWLEQFRSLEKEWIGAALLKLLAIWPSNTVCEELFTPVLNKGVRGKPPKAKDWLDSYEHIIHNDVSHGASSTVILRFLKTRWGDRFLASVKPIDALPKLNVTEGTRILFLEDCIMTGQEAIETLKRAEITQALERGSVDFKVAVATRWGIERVRAYAALAGLGGAFVLEPRSGLIENLSQQGEGALKRGELFRTGPGQPVCVEGHVVCGVNIAAKGAFNRTERLELVRFCRTIGKQLMFHHFLANGYPADEASDQGGRQCFGFGNLGLLLVFAHGVPDNTIPLFWLGGEVSYEGHVFEWSPLFPQPALPQR